MKQLNQVEEFHLKYGAPVLSDIDIIEPERFELRKKLIKEEFNELVEAIAEGEKASIAKEACDLIYVTLGTVLEMGEKENFLSVASMFSELPVGVLVEDHFGNLRDFVLRFIRLGEWNCLYPIFFSTLCSARSFGIPPEKIGLAFDEVHSSNMSKGTDGKPVFDEGGKVLKGEDYVKADLSFINHSDK